MKELFLDREKILSSVSTNSFEDWIKENYDEELHNRIVACSSKFTNTLVYSLAVLILIVAILTKPVVDAVLGLGNLTVIESYCLCITAVTLSVVMPVSGYKFALFRAGEEWREYRKLWILAKKRYEHSQKRLKKFMRSIK